MSRAERDALGAPLYDGTDAPSFGDRELWPILRLREFSAIRAANFEPEPVRLNEVTVESR
jgi:hypothetical protein